LSDPSYQQVEAGAMRSLLATLFVVCLFGATAEGALILTADSLTWDRTASTTSESFTVGIENDSVTESMVGWQLKIETVPKTGATGTLQFDSVVKPSSYVMEGVGDNFRAHVNPSVVFPTETIVSSDDDSQLVGVVVPGDGDNILSFAFSTPDSALGQFDVVLRTGPGNSYWFDDSLTTEFQFEGQAYMGGDDIYLGTVTVTPEPSALALGGLAMLGGGAYTWLRRRRASTSKRKSTR
jgi:LPXTG-motif cell wall-anchored protein